MCPVARKIPKGEVLALRGAVRASLAVTTTQRNRLMAALSGYSKAETLTRFEVC